jgi:hypothetical protein
MRILFLLLVIFSANVSSKGVEPFPIEEILTPIEVHKLFEAQYVIPVTGLVDIIDNIEKIDICIEEYKKKQSKSYAKIVQNNLYDLMNNFERILSKIYGKKPGVDEISYDEKVEVLAKLQCKAYYRMEILK